MANVFEVVQDKQGNAVPGVQVKVYTSSALTTLATVTDDADEEIDQTSTDSALNPLITNARGEYYGTVEYGVYSLTFTLDGVQIREPLLNVPLGDGTEAATAAATSALAYRNEAADFSTAAETAATAAETAEGNAESYQTGAQSARDATVVAAASVGVYADPVLADAKADGLADTVEGEAFYAVGDDEEYFSLCRHDAGPVATEIAQVGKYNPAVDSFMQAINSSLFSLVADEQSVASFDFAANIAIIRDAADATKNVAGTAQSALTIAADTDGMILNASGVLVASTSNTLRIDHDADGNPIGVLVEPAATNLATRSKEFDDAGYTKTNLTVGTDALNGPDGTATAETLTENTTDAAHQTAKSIGSITDATTYTYSVFLKKDDRRYAAIGLAGAGILSPDQPHLIVDFDTGEAFPVNPEAIASLSEFSLRDYGGGWFRLSLTATSASTANLSIRIYGQEDATYDGRSYLGDSSVAFAAWGTQAELGGRATSFIPTVGASTASRTADTITLATTDIKWATTGTVFIKAVTPWGTGSSVLWQADDGTEDERIRLERDADGHIHFIVTDGGVEQCDLDLGAVSPNREFQVTATWGSGDFAASLDGATPVTDTAGTIPTVTTLRFGHSFTGEQWCGYIKTFVHVPRRVS